MLTCVAAVAISSAALPLRDDYANARIATAYAAKQSCSCVHVGGRALAACVAELPDADQVRVTQDGAHMRASLLFGAISAEAVYEDGYGCTIAN